MQASSIHDVLAGCPLFTGCTPDTLRLLSAASRHRPLLANEFLVHQGSDSKSMFVVATGVLRVFTTSPQGDEPTLTMVFAGDSVGELGALDGAPRMASIAALQRCAVVEVGAAALRDAYVTDHSIARAMVAQMSARLRATGERLGDMVVLELGSRLAKFLIAEVHRQLDESPRRAEIEMPFTQAQLGQLLGGARQTINQELAELERGGMIRVTGRRVEVLDLQGLQVRSRGLP